MSLKDNKLEIAIVVVGLVLIGSVGNLFKAPVQRALQNNEISFEMIRPKSILAALFDLGGREVARNYVNPFGNKKATEEAKTTPNTEDKTKSAAAAAKTAQKKADDKKSEDKKPTTDIRVVSADPGFKAGGDDTSAGGAAGGAYATGGTTGADNNKSGATDKDKMTANQWRSLVLGQPTKENVNKMVVAYMDKDLTDTEFYGIVNELLKNSNTETQSLGLSAASSFYSSTAFNTVASNYKALSTENQTTAMAYMLGFANAGRLSALASSLKNSDSEVVALAAEVVVKGYNSAKSGTTTSSPRSRGDAFANALTNYDQFRDIFKSLKESSNAEIVSVATSALSQIQSGVASL